MLYTKRNPDLTEAIQFTGSNAATIRQFLPNVVELENHQLKIETPQNIHIVAASQWVCRIAPRGTVFLLDDYTFKANYMPLNIGKPTPPAVDVVPQPQPRVLKSVSKLPKQPTKSK